MKAVLKFFVSIVLFIVLFLYCFKSAFYMKESKGQYSVLMPKYLKLLEKKEYLKIDLDSLRYKINGITEKTLNKDILEERAKIMLNYKNKDELVITN